MQKIKIFIADDHKLIRQCLRGLIESDHNMTVIGEAENGGRAIALTEKLSPDVILMDLAMPEVTGIDLSRSESDQPLSSHRSNREAGI